MAAAIPLVGGVVGSLASSLLGGKKKDAAAPAAAPTPVMPIADDEKVKMARKRSLIAQQQRQGRVSTILTTDSEALGR